MAELPERPLIMMNFVSPTHSAFAPGKALAYGTLCRLICRQMEAPPGGWLLGHFYYLLRDGLSEREDMRCVYAILLNSSPIFSLALDGASILIPHYLMAIKHLVRPNSLGLDLNDSHTLACSL